MTAPAVIKASYCDWRTVKGRKVLQLVFEVPLEQQEEALKVLGAPLPDRTLWCAIAVLTDEAAKKDPAKSERAKQSYAEMDAMEQARTRASLLCKDPRFIEWMWGERWSQIAPDTAPQQTAQRMREMLGIASRSEIASNDRAYDAFLSLETSYKQSIGQFAEAR